jgi:hypothetical protein
MVLDKTTPRKKGIHDEEMPQKHAVIYLSKLGKVLSLLVLIAMFYTILSYTWPYIQF